MSIYRGILSRAFTKYPLIANSLIYGGTYMGAEFSQQIVLRKFVRPPNTPEKPYDYQTIKNYGIVGITTISPTLYFWYTWLDNRLKGTGWKVVVQKCLMDQFMIVPVIIVMFYVGMSYLEDKSDVMEEMRTKALPTFVANALMWLPAQAVNFAYVAPKFRIVYIGVCNFAWANILCLFKRDGED